MFKQRRRCGLDLLVCLIPGTTGAESCTGSSDAQPLRGTNLGNISWAPFIGVHCGGRASFRACFTDCCSTMYSIVNALSVCLMHAEVASCPRSRGTHSASCVRTTSRQPLVLRNAIAGTTHWSSRHGNRILQHLSCL